MIKGVYRTDTMGVIEGVSDNARQWRSTAGCRGTVTVRGQGTIKLKPKLPQLARRIRV